MARRRSFILERRLSRNPALREKYQQFIREYEQVGHMEQVSSKIDEGYYLPHQAVLRESSLTTKLRVVFDASTKITTGVSLNETMMVGPSIQDGIFELILRFLQHAVVLSADITKMYRQFLVHPEDTSYQKILWRDGERGSIKTYQLKTVTYGTSSAPFLAKKCLKQLADDEGESFPLAAEVLKKDFYVDDLLTGADSLEEARNLRDQLIKLTDKAGVHLCKWTSNDRRVIEDLSESLSKIRLMMDPEKTTRTLGVCWNSDEDTLEYEICFKPHQEPLTKWTILSQIAQLYDPFGLLVPVIVHVKIMIQKLWKSGLSWDDPISSVEASAWNLYQAQMDSLTNWRIPRTLPTSGAVRWQLHGFSDASEVAYGACIYLRVSVGEQHRSLLLCAKSRVAPIKSLSSKVGALWRGSTGEVI